MATFPATREITYILRMRNESQQAIRQFTQDLLRLNQAVNGARTPNVSPGGGGGGGTITPRPTTPGSSGGSGGGGSGGNSYWGRLVDGNNANAVQGLAGAYAILNGNMLAGIRTFGLYAAATGVATMALREIIQAGDAANQMIGRLAVSIGNRALAENVFGQIARDAQQMGIPLDASIAAFNRFNLASRQVGVSLEQTRQFTRTLQQLAVVSGTTATESRAAFMQLGQALASGRLQGDELRSALENFPQLAQLIAQSMNTSIGELRRLGAEGKLTPEVIFRAVEQGQRQIDAQFRSMPLTVERASEQMAQGFSAVARELDRQLQLSQNLARVMQMLGNVAQATADRMVPETALTRYQSVTRELQIIAERQRQVAEGEQSLRNQPSRNSISSGLQGAAASQNAGTDGARVRQLQREQEAIGELMRAEIRLQAQRQLAERADRERSAQEARDAQLREAARQTLEDFGLANANTAQRIERLQQIQAAGADAMQRYGMSAQQAGVYLDLLRQKVDPLASGISELNNQLRVLQAQGAGAIRGTLEGLRIAAEGRGITDPGRMREYLTDAEDRLRRIANQRGANNIADREQDLADRQAMTAARRSRDPNAGAVAAGNIEVARRRREGVTDEDILARYRAQAEAEERLAGAYNRSSSAGARRAAITENRIDQVRVETQALNAEAEALRLTGVQQTLEIARIRARNELRQRSSTTPPSQEAVNQLAAANIERARAQANRDIEESIRDRRRGYEDELSLLGLSGDALERQRLSIEMTNQARRAGIDIESAAFQQQLQRAQQDLTQFQLLAADRRSDPFAGALAGLRHFTDEAKDLYTQLSQASNGWLNGASDALTEFALTGKANFADFANSVIRDIARILARQALMQVANAGMSMFGGGTPVPAFSGSATFAHDGWLVGGPGRKLKRFHDGGLTSDEVPLIARRGEVIMPTVTAAGGGRGVRVKMGNFETIMPISRLGNGTMGIDGRGVQPVAKFHEGGVVGGNPNPLATALAGSGGAPGASTNVFSPTIQINMATGASGNGQSGDGKGLNSREAANAIGRIAQDAVRVELVKFVEEQQRPGGVLAPRLAF